MDDTIPEGKRVVRYLSQHEADLLENNTLSNQLLQEIIRRLKEGDNLAFLQHQKDGTTQLTVYGLEYESKLNRVSESVIGDIQEFVNISPLKRSVMFKRNDVNLTKASYKIKRAESAQYNEVKSYLDDLSDRFSEKVASGIQDLENAINSQQDSTAQSSDDIGNVFLSYSYRNRDRVKSVEEILLKHDVNYFLGEKNIKPGDYWTEKVRESIWQCSKFWMLITPQALESKWVTIESTIAWGLKKNILPIFHQCGPQDLPDILRGVQGVDLMDLEEKLDFLDL